MAFGSWTSVPTGTSSLFLGWDEASGGSLGHFKGAVDEFRLYSRTLSQDAVHGLMWFLKGSNSVIVPRGVFYDSLLFKQMTNASSADIMNGPLAGANVHANNNNLSSNLNSRVIQMVIDKNLTLADAYRLLTLLWTNKTGNVTVFAFFATSQFHTLGFAWEVSKLVANTSVASGGNYTESPPAPPPKGPWWVTAWNTITGVFQYIWNAVVAVMVFFGNAARWLADVFIGLTYGLVTGNWTYFENNVVQPFKKALEVFVQFIVSLVSSFVNSILSPVINSVAQLVRVMAQDFQGAFLGLAQEFFAGGVSRQTKQRFGESIFGNAFWVIFAIALVVEVVLVAVGVMTIPFSFVMSTILVIVLGLVLMALIGKVLNQFFRIEPDQIALVPKAIFDAAVALALGAGYTPKINPKSSPGAGLGTRGVSTRYQTLSDASNGLELLAAGFDGMATILSAIVNRGSKSGMIMLGIGIAMGFIAVLFSIFVISSIPPPFHDILIEPLSVVLILLALIDAVVAFNAAKKPDVEVLEKWLKPLEYIAIGCAALAIVIDVASFTVH